MFTPADTVGVMSVCAISLNGTLGANFGCGNDVSQITSSTEKDPQGAGNALGVLNIGQLLNKGKYRYIHLIFHIRLGFLPFSPVLENPV